ncbi:uncharacterized protein LOC132925062 [Rhopalosiphum padi]|uniref:uncharacterized protein LOC132925062 n=1 Tax=Rhopalosiphum padi TaxID=40932 RepID=UPI00298D648E|nr:uncharacterized protein LOC132925062 [Rhopalosiphum padi]
MTSIIVVLIITITITSGGAKENTLPRVAPPIYDSCPSLESAEYQVTMIDSVKSLVSGCAYISYNYSLNSVSQQSLRLWFGTVEYNSQSCHYQGMEYFNFYCMGKLPSPTEDTKEGRMRYIRLYDADANKAGNSDHRCALYKTGIENATTFRMAVSENTSCDGLLNILSRPKMKIPEYNKGSMLLLFNKTRLNTLVTSPLPDTTITESMESIAISVEGDFLQHFGNRLNQFGGSSALSTAVQNKTKREQRHALPYAFAGVGGRGSVMFLYNSQSAMNENEDTANTTTTTMDKNRLRESLEIEHIQKRRRRSVSNVKSTSKIDVPVLAGINPFSLILVNRGHNNKTGSIKPLGLWDQITKLFKD